MEQRAAQTLNPTEGKRVPLSGMNSGHGTSSDGRFLYGLYMENKHRASMTALTLLRDTIKKAKAEGKIPVCTLHEKNMQGLGILLHSHSLDDFLVTECVLRGVSPFEDQCSQCSSNMFTEKIEPWVNKDGEEMYPGYLVRRCAMCGQPIKHRAREIDEGADDELFERETSLPLQAPFHWRA